MILVKANVWNGIFADETEELTNEYFKGGST